MNLIQSLNLPPIVYTVLGVLQLVFLFHALKTGRGSPWFFVLLFLPGIGVLLYLIIEIIPGFGNTRTGIELADWLQSTTKPKLSFEELKNKAQTLPTISNLEALADAYVAQNDNKQAIKYYQQAVGNEPGTYPDIHRKLAKAFITNKQYKEAQSQLTIVLQSDDARADDHILLAKTYEELDHLDKALAEYNKGVPFTTNLSAHYHYGKLLNKLHKTTELNALVKTANTAFTEFTPKLQREQRTWINKINEEFAAKQ